MKILHYTMIMILLVLSTASYVQLHADATVPLTIITIPGGANSPSCGNSCITPQNVTVDRGTAVQWINNDLVPHFIVSGNSGENDTGSLFNSGSIFVGSNFIHDFNDVGVFHYFDPTHTWDTGTINVINDTLSVFSSQSIPANSQSNEELAKKIASARDTIANLMINGTGDIPFNEVGVIEKNMTLDVGIDSTKATLSEEQYLEKIKAIVGDIPIKITFGIINPTANMTSSSAGNSFSKSIPSPLKQLEFGTQSENIQCNVNFVLIFKMENNSPACVTPQTGTKLIQIGWAMPTISLKPWMVTDTRGLKNDTGTITLENQTYYFDTPNYTEDAYSHSPQITFHGILFTLFPQPFSGGLPTGNCGPDGSDSYYWADAKFPDGTHEMLKILVDTEPCALNSIPANLSTHTNPQAGLTFYDGKMKLLVSTGITNSSGSYLPTSFTSCDIPFVQKQSDVSPLFPNDTQITTSYTPVFFMPANSTGNFCVQYTNGNAPSQSAVRIFEALNLSKNANDTQIFPQSVPVPTGNTNTTFTIKSGNSGFYGIGFLCGGFPLAVGYDNNSKLVKGDFPWLNQDFNCPAITYSLDFVGTRGIGTYYIPTVTHSKIDYNITGTSVSSVHLSPTIQNVTFSINVQTFNDSSNFWFDIKDSDYVKFNGDPKLVEESSDPCTWTFTNDNAIPDESQWYKMTGKVTVTDRPVTFPPHTNGTYSFSVLAKDLDTGYYGLDPIFYGRPTDSNVPLENMGGGSVASYYPVVIGLDKYLDPSGVCSR